MSELEDGSSNAWNYSESGNSGVAGNIGLNVPDSAADGMFSWVPNGSIQNNTQLTAIGGSATGTDKTAGDFAADTEEADIFVLDRNSTVATFSIGMSFVYLLDAPSSVLPGTYTHVITVSKTEN